MPIYEFTCQNCGAEFEKLVSFSDNLSVDCPVCQSSKVQRQMGLPAVHFKGSGWYITDSKGNSKGTNKESDKLQKSSEKTTADETGGSIKSSEQDSKNSAQGNSSASSNGRQEGTGASVQEK